MTNTTHITMGCRLNTYETEVMAKHAKAAGLNNAVIVNTCAVTNEAVRQARQRIRKIAREQPEARIIVTGCAAQIEPETFAAMGEVDAVVGNAEKMRAETFVALKRGTLSPANSPCKGTSPLTPSGFQRTSPLAGCGAKPHETFDLGDILPQIDSFSGRARAYVQVQNGCDHRCTFCIIPYGRGVSRSTPAGAVVAQIERLVDNGHNEIVLTGVDITDYGADLPGTQSLGTLTKQILRHVPQLKRLRLSSIDQIEIDYHLLDVIAYEPRLMPHLHLSLQAGDDMILKRMKRRHSRADSIRFCAQIKRLRPDIVFGADIIAGFPTETESMFANSLALIDECDLTYLHVFPFSPRQGTPAAKMPQIERQVVKARAARLRQKGAKALTAQLNGQTGRRVDILMERDNIGRTPQFNELELSDIVPNHAHMLKKSAGAAGEIISAVVTGNDGRRLIGYNTD